MGESEHAELRNPAGTAAAALRPPPSPSLLTSFVVVVLFAAVMPAVLACAAAVAAARSTAAACRQLADAAWRCLRPAAAWSVGGGLSQTALSAALDAVAAALRMAAAARKTCEAMASRLLPHKGPGNPPDTLNDVYVAYGNDCYENQAQLRLTRQKQWQARLLGAGAASLRRWHPRSAAALADSWARLFGQPGSCARAGCKACGGAVAHGGACGGGIAPGLAPGGLGGGGSGGGVGTAGVVLPAQSADLIYFGCHSPCPREHVDTLMDSNPVFGSELEADMDVRPAPGRDAREEARAGAVAVGGARSVGKRGEGGAARVAASAASAARVAGALLEKEKPEKDVGALSRLAPLQPHAMLPAPEPPLSPTAAPLRATAPLLTTTTLPPPPPTSPPTTTPPPPLTPQSSLPLRAGSEEHDQGHTEEALPSVDMPDVDTLSVDMLRVNTPQPLQQQQEQQHELGEEQQRARDQPHMPEVPALQASAHGSGANSEPPAVLDAAAATQQATQVAPQEGSFSQWPTQPSAGGHASSGAACGPASLLASLTASTPPGAAASWLQAQPPGLRTLHCRAATQPERNANSQKAAAAAPAAFAESPAARRAGGSSGGGAVPWEVWRAAMRAGGAAASAPVTPRRQATRPGRGATSMLDCRPASSSPVPQRRYSIDSHVHAAGTAIMAAAPLPWSPRRGSLDAVPPRTGGYGAGAGSGGGGGSVHLQCSPLRRASIDAGAPASPSSARASPGSPMHAAGVAGTGTRPVWGSSLNSRGRLATCGVRPKQSTSSTPI
uniref:Uncharacterized protein n=1 Tax=Chlamydomonas euryale TaxID=1486919 RepID=A0A7R9UZK3_9CHLO